MLNSWVKKFQAILPSSWVGLIFLCSILRKTERDLSTNPQENISILYWLNGGLLEPLNRGPCERSCWGFLGSTVDSGFDWFILTSSEVVHPRNFSPPFPHHLLHRQKNSWHVKCLSVAQDGWYYFIIKFKCKFDCNLDTILPKGLVNDSKRCLRNNQKNKVKYGKKNTCLFSFFQLVSMNQSLWGETQVEMNIKASNCQ